MRKPEGGGTQARQATHEVTQMPTRDHGVRTYNDVQLLGTMQRGSRYMRFKGFGSVTRVMGKRSGRLPQARVRVRVTAVRHPPH